MSYFEDQVLQELRSIRELFEWRKTDILQQRKLAKASEEQDQIDYIQGQRDLMAEAQDRMLEKVQQTNDEHGARMKAEWERVKAEHEAQYHGTKSRGGNPA